MREPVEIVFASTGITSSTSKVPTYLHMYRYRYNPNPNPDSTPKVVADVKAKKDADPAWYDQLALRYREIFAEASTALAAGDWAALGQAMAKNHAVCQDRTDTLTPTLTRTLTLT